MMMNLKTGMMIAAAAALTMALTACGNSNTITALTDSDAIALTSSASSPALGVVEGGLAESNVPQVAAQSVPSVPAVTVTPEPDVLPKVVDEPTSTPAEAPAQVNDSTQPLDGTNPDAAADEAAQEEEEEFIPAGEGNTGVTTTDVKFRAEPDTSDDENVIDEINEGTEVIVLDVVDDWYKVQIGDEVGYIKAQYVN